MSFQTFLGIVGALAVALLLALITPHETSVIKNEDQITLAPLEEPSPPISPSLPEIKEAEKTSAANSTELPGARPVASAPESSAPPAPLVGNFDASAATLRAAIVNIVCSGEGLGTSDSISGSGVFVDARGIILTNAHIAQYFLLENNKEPGCLIRIGSPARPMYEASPLFISKSWLTENPSTLLTHNPTGTGENDFALIAVTKSATRDPLPTSFPSVEISKRDAARGEGVVVGAYPAQFLGSTNIAGSLYPTLAYASVVDLYTFKENTEDLISLGGNPAAQQGSSGGGVVGIDGTLKGLIVTSTIEGATKDRELRAITPSHIRRSYSNETGNSFDEFLARAISENIVAFALEIPALRALIQTEAQ